MTSRRFAVGLGSNVGDREALLDAALARIQRLPGVRVLATSRLYESAGWGREDLAPFYNAALAAESDTLDAPAFLAELRHIEDELGRQRTITWGPRTLDLDLLAADDEVYESEALTLPHPWISRRPFVYTPLAKIAHLHPAWPQLAEPHPEGRAIEKDTAPIEVGRGVWGRCIDTVDSAEIETCDEEQTLALGRSLARHLLPGDTIALNAAMGAGKSVFARGIARGLGITGPIQSPTYTLCRRYEDGRLPFEHWDFYRLESLDDLESTGFDDSETDRVLRAIEWSCHFPEALGREIFEVTLSIQPDGARRITLQRPRGGALPFTFLAAFTPLESGAPTR